MTTNKPPLGKTGPSVFPLALGCMSMGAGSGYGASDEGESIATIHAALERGVNLIDTGDFYGMGKNELLVGKALRDRRDKALLSVKFGALRGPDGALPRLRRAPERDQELPRPQPVAARRRLHRHLPSGAPRSRGAHRRDGGRDRRHGEGRLRPSRRPLGGRRGHDPPGRQGAPDRRSADRVLADQPRPRGHDLPGRSPSWASRSPPTGCCRAASSRAASRRRRRHARALAALRRRNGAKNEALVAALARLAAGKGVTPASSRSPGSARRALAQNVTVVPTMGARTRKQLADALCRSRHHAGRLPRSPRSKPRSPRARSRARAIPRR